MNHRRALGKWVSPVHVYEVIPAGWGCRWRVLVLLCLEPVQSAVTSAVGIKRQSGDFPGGPDSVLPVQGARVRSLVGEVDPACVPQLRSPHAATKIPRATTKIRRSQNKKNKNNKKFFLKRQLGDFPVPKYSRDLQHRVISKCYTQAKPVFTVSSTLESLS